MKLLLDTHTFLWLVEGNSNLSSNARTALGDPVNSLYLSAASVWELAIKTANKKLALSDPLEDYVPRWVSAYQIAYLPIDASHSLAVSRLSDHHRDPFDRMLVAQATVEQMTLVSSDARLAAYSVPILW